MDNITVNVTDIIESIIANITEFIDTITVTVIENGYGYWGYILGTLSDQIDLQAALDLKSNTSHNHALNNLSEKSYNSLNDKPTIPTLLSQLEDDSTHRIVTDIEKGIWNGKQNALGFTPENVANLRTIFQVTPDNTHYISEKLAKDSLDGKQNTITNIDGGNALS